MMKVMYMKNNLISIIVPVYNLEWELPRCLDSILAQTYENLEIVVVDDGSRDRSFNVMCHYAELDERIKPIYQNNGGVMSARLTGIKQARGEWIGFVDGDDEIEPNMYERLLENAYSYHADISHCGYQMYFADGRVNYFHNTGCLTEQDRITGLKDLLAGSKIEPGLCNKLFHKNLFHNLLHRDVLPMDIKINEDLLMNFYLFLEAEHSVYEDFCPYHYIVRNTSASRQKLNKYKIYDPIGVKKRILEVAPVEIKRDAERALFCTYINIYNTIILSDQPEFQEDARHIRQTMIEQWSKVNQISKKQQLLARMIRYIPVIYPIIYNFYSTKLQKNPYQ